MKKTLLALSLIAMSAGAFASTGTITINGKVTDVTCTVDINGQPGGDYTVTLPTVSASDLKTGMTAGAKRVIITAKECTPSGSLPAGINAAFEQSNINPATGNLLNNTADATGAKNVEIQIANSEMKPINLLTDENNTVSTFTAGTAEMNYYVQYAAPVADAQAGLVTSSVVYSLNYQ